MGVALAVAVGVVPVAQAAGSTSVAAASAETTENLKVPVGPEPDGTAVILDAAVRTPAGGDTPPCSWRTASAAPRTR